MISRTLRGLIVSSLLLNAAAAVAAGPASANYQIRASVMNEGGSPEAGVLVNSPSYQLRPASLGEMAVGPTESASYEVIAGFSAGRPTAAAGLAVTGTVSLDPPRLDGVFATVEALDAPGGTVIASTTTDVAGNFSLNLPPDASYTFAADHSHALWATLTVDTSGGGAIVLPAVTLTAGEVNGDGTINITDITTVAASFGSGDPDADVNGDGTVNITDITTVAANFGASAPTPW